MSTATARPYGRTVLWYFLGFFGIIIVVNVTMATLAVRTLSGVVTDHPYERGLAYNHVVDAVAEQQSLGWKGTISYTKGTLNFVLKDKNGNTLVPDEATATITRPTSQGHDFNVLLKGQHTPVTFAEQGQWEVRIDATRAGTHYQQAQRLVIQ